jgi:hypothetical protein
MRALLSAVGLLCALASVAVASPTGLNNIPTADVVPKGVLVLQQYSDFGADQQPGYFAGAKWGPAKRLEVGVDSRLGTGEGGPAVFQAKYRFLDDDARLSAAVGIANVSGSARAGDEALYIALKRNVSASVRGHLGFLTAGGDDALFFGADGPMGATKWDWKADGIQVRDGRDWLFAVGTIGPLGRDLVLESWVTFPTENGRDPTWLLKFDWVIGQ